MSLRTSVTGCIAMLGVASVASGCAGQVPGQARAIDLRAMAPAAAQLAVGDGARAAAALKAMAATPTAADAAKDPAAGAALAQAAVPTPTKGPDAAPAEPKADEKAADQPTEKLAAAVAPTAVEPTSSEAKPGGEPVAAEAAPAAPTTPDLVAAKAAAEPVAPEVGFVIPSLTDLAAVFTPDVPPVLFQDSFNEGLAAWVTRGMGAMPTPGEDADAVVLATSKARRSLWIKTRTEIDLAGAAQPRLRLDFKGEAVALKAVWETDNGDFPEEILLTPAAASDDAAEAAPPEFDLAALKGRPGHLVLVAKAPKGRATAPVLDAVTIYDAATI